MSRTTEWHGFAFAFILYGASEHGEDWEMHEAFEDWHHGAVELTLHTDGAIEVPGVYIYSRQFE